MRYTIKPGDSLSTIARAHGLSLAELLAANPQRRANPDAIRVGDEVEIPDGATATPPSVPVTTRPSTGGHKELGKLSEEFETGGRGHSCGIYSFSDDHINRLAMMAPVSRIMVRQVQSSSNAGTFTNGMPMTSSMGCGVWGGNITNENISLKHYMNVTWVSRPIAEDRPSEQELFGEFYNSEIF